MTARAPGPEVLRGRPEGTFQGHGAPGDHAWLPRRLQGRPGRTAGTRTCGASPGSRRARQAGRSRQPVKVRA